MHGILAGEGDSEAKSEDDNREGDGSIPPDKLILSSTVAETTSIDRKKKYLGFLTTELE